MPPSMTLDQAAATIAPWSRTFALTTGPDALDQARSHAAEDPLGQVVACAELADPASSAAAEVVAAHREIRGMPPTRFAASLAFQRYAHRVAGVATAIWFMDRRVVPLTLARTWLVVAGGNPTRLILPEPGEFTGGDAERLVATVVDDHLLPVAERFHEVGGVGLPNLWGNIGAAFGAACQNLAKHHPAEEVRRVGEEVLATRARLRGAGNFCLLDDPAGSRLFFERNSCCHWHDVSGKNCAWCSDLDHEEHLRRFRARLARG